MNGLRFDQGVDIYRARARRPPKLCPLEIAGASRSMVSAGATINERLGVAQRGEGLAALAVVLQVEGAPGG